MHAYTYSWGGRKLEGERRGRERGKDRKRRERGKSEEREERSRRGEVKSRKGEKREGEERRGRREEKERGGWEGFLIWSLSARSGSAVSDKANTLQSPNFPTLFCFPDFSSF